MDYQYTVIIEPENPEIRESFGHHSWDNGPKSIDVYCSFLADSDEEAIDRVTRELPYDPTLKGKTLSVVRICTRLRMPQ